MLTGSPSAVITLGLGSWGSPSLLLTLGYGSAEVTPELGPVTASRRLFPRPTATYLPHRSNSIRLYPRPSTTELGNR